ncbi:MAG: RsmD family RNA methyltransferase [Chitinophagales bacterium]
MRIIGGNLGGRKIVPPSKMPHTRPTTDIAKEGLFNIIQNNLLLQGMKTLDLFGGTGSISYELASHGAGQQIIVERDPKLSTFIKKTAASLGISNLTVIRADAFKFLKQCHETFDFIFAGPPYALQNIDELADFVVTKQLLKPNGWFVLEHTARNNYENYPMYTTQRNYGTTVFSIFVNKLPNSAKSGG